MTRLAILLILLPMTTLADPAQVETVVAKPSASGWTFHVTIRHADTGWDDYADGWRVETEDGTELGFRKLLHPHVNEQPFTRSLSGVAIPDATKQIYIRARTLTEGWGDDRTEVALEQ